MNPCTIPTPAHDHNGDKRWQSMHNRYVSEAKTSEAEVLFIGDSIIQQMQFTALWTENISSLHCLNFGIGGDRVEHVLWRMLNGELDFIKKQIKVVVLFVGTNNTDCKPEQVFEGILECVKVIKQKLGDVTVILPTLLPKGPQPNIFREKNESVNKLLIDKFMNKSDASENDATFDKGIHIVVIHENILEKDKSLSHHIMHDYLHLTNSGYTKIFTPVYTKLCQLLNK